MIRSSLLVVSALLAGAPNAAAAPAEADALLAFAKPETPGCAVSAVLDGKTVLERVGGAADLEHAVPITPASVFEAGSVSKQFTAASVLLLVQDGKLRLDDDIRRYFPELPNYGATITVDHLLRHTSGLREWSAVAIFAGWPRTTRAVTQNDVLDMIVRQNSLNHRPGAEFAYTNSGYVLLAMLVERVSGRPLAEFSRERLFEPLGMASTGWRDDFRRVVQNRAIAYEPGPKGWRQNMPFEDVYGHGGLLTTVADLQTWNAALASRRLGAFVSDSLEDRTLLPGGKRAEHARGLFVARRRGQLEIAHAGGTAGYRAWLGRYPAQKLSVAVLCNAASADPVGLGHKIADQWLPAAEPAAATSGAAAGPFRNAQVRAGLYIDAASGMTMRLAPVAGGMQVEGGPLLTAAGPDRLQFRGDDVVFVGDDEMRLSMRGTPMVFRKVTAAPSEAELAALAGRYASDEVGAVYRAAVEKGGLTLRLERRAADVVFPLTPVAPDTFAMKYGTVTFRRSAGGAIEGLSFSMERMTDLRFQRVGAQ